MTNATASNIRKSQALANQYDWLQMSLAQGAGQRSPQINSLFRFMRESRKKGFLTISLYDSPDETYPMEQAALLLLDFMNIQYDLYRYDGGGLVLIEGSQLMEDAKALLEIAPAADSHLVKPVKTGKRSHVLRNV